MSSKDYLDSAREDSSWNYFERVKCPNCLDPMKYLVRLGTKKNLDYCKQIPSTGPVQG